MLSPQEETGDHERKALGLGLVSFGFMCWSWDGNENLAFFC